MTEEMGHAILSTLSRVEQLLSFEAVPARLDSLIANKLASCVALTTTGQRVQRELSAMSLRELEDLQSNLELELN